MTVTAIPAGALIVPTTTDLYQVISVQLGDQDCTIRLYAKSIYVPQYSPVLPIPNPPLPPQPVSPAYENANPVFLDLLVSNVLIIGGAIVLNNVPVVRDAYLGFSGDLVVVDTQGEDDPAGMSLRLPPQTLKNRSQLAIFPAQAEYAPADIANTIVDMGTRFLLCYLPP